ncbi:ExeA family protein [Hydrocarboniphaga sp.]|uniref:ExeA family protein n=1 Tax=Hydrocarboniphaga sp. TaxID=2033016 RepID=UPI0026250DF7|nr:ExeA family protein [Hydrocarboniphaga sp.]
MPFTITPDPSYLYLSPRHQEALGHLLYGTGQYGGFVQLTGEVGTGKTTVVRTLLEQKLVDVDVAMIHNPSQNELQFVQSICDELGVVYERANLTLKTLVDALNAHLLKVHAAGRRTVLIIDEAQNLPRDVLEQVRLLTNLETHKEKLLRIMLIGQPELAELLARPDLRQLASRITARYHLMPLSEPETGEYIRHRLRVAGSNEDVFAPAAIREIHRAARGVPRLINILCDRSLLGAYAQGTRRVTPEIVRKAAVESIGTASAETGSTQAPRRLPAWLTWRPTLAQLEATLAVVALIIAGLLLYETFFPRDANPPAVQVAAAEPQKAPEPKQAAVPPPAEAANAATHSPAPAEPKKQEAAPPAAPPAATVAGSPSPKAEKPKAAATPPPAKPNSKTTPPATAAATTPAAATDIETAAPLPPLPANADLTTLLQSTQPLPTVVSRLIRLWNRDIVIDKGANVCRELSARGLECYKSNGEWADLRNMNRPAVLSLTTGRGEVQHVLLRGLTATFATLDTARGTIGVPLDQLDALWSGEFLLLWKRETAETYLTPGAHGSSVTWVRRRLAEFNNEPASEPVSDHYDQSLVDQIKHFQTQRGLDSDGVIGTRTLIALGERSSGTPTLAAPR